MRRMFSDPILSQMTKVTRTRLAFHLRFIRDRVSKYRYLSRLTRDTRTCIWHAWKIIIDIYWFYTLMESSFYKYIATIAHLIVVFTVFVVICNFMAFAIKLIKLIKNFALYQNLLTLCRTLFASFFPPNRDFK